MSPVWSQWLHGQWPSSFPEQPGGTREPRLDTYVSYQVSASLSSPEVPGSPVWIPVLVIRSVHRMALKQPRGIREPRLDPGVSY